MSLFPQSARTIFAVTDAAGNARAPVNADALAFFTTVEAILSALGLSAPLLYTSKSAMDADLAHAANTAALVIGDATRDNNGLYVKSGASGSGSWTKVAGVPGGEWAYATNSGAGTANAIKVTTPATASKTDGATLFAFGFTTPNTSTTVTVEMDGDGSPLTIVGPEGEGPPIGALVPGGGIAGFIAASGTKFIAIYGWAGLYASQAAASAAAAASDAADAHADKLSADADAATATTQAGIATNAASVAQAALENLGVTHFYDTYSAANSAVGGLSDGDVVQVWADETHENQRTFYVVASGALAFKADANNRPTGTVVLRYDTTASAWLARDPLGQLIDISATNTGGIQECLDYCEAHGYNFDIVGGANSSAGDTAQSIISVPNQVAVPPMRFWSWRVRGITFDFSTLDDDGFLFNSLANFEIDFEASQMVYRGSNAAVRFWPTTAVPGDPTTGIGVGTIKFPASIAVYGTGSRCVRFTPTTDGSIGGVRMIFGELNGGMTDGSGSPSDTVAIQVDQAAVNFGFFDNDITAYIIHGCGSTAVKIGSAAQSSLGCIVGNRWTLLGTNYTDQTFLKTYGYNDVFTLSAENNGLTGTTGFEIMSGAKGNTFIVANNDAVTPYTNSSSNSNLILQGGKITFTNSSGGLGITIGDHVDLDSNLTVRWGGASADAYVQGSTSTKRVILGAQGGARITAGASLLQFNDLATAGMMVTDSSGVVSVKGTNPGWAAQTASQSKADLGASPTVGQIASYLATLDALLKANGIIST